MKAVILAAGRGTRISSVTQGRPKSLLSVGDRSILDFQIEGLFRVGVTELAVVVGYKEHEIVRHVVERHEDKMGHIHFVTNREFASTNNMYSLWLARHWLGDEKFLCVNADVLCHPDILQSAVACRPDISVVIDREFRDETTKVIIRDARVVALSKSISLQEYSGTFVNVATFSPQGAHALFEKAEARFADGDFSQCFNDVISDLAAEGVAVDFIETDDLPWAEVDDPNDLLFAKTHVYPQLEPLFVSTAVLLDGAP
ncbi:MAG: sugar phosphate nucleotidyltransferase [Acidobacteriota bacterium]